MGMNMYIVTFKGGYNEETSRSVALLVKRLGGFILMVTRNGPVVAIDDSQAAALNRHPAVEFVGGVTYNPRGVAAQELQRLFVENASKQVERSDSPVSDSKDREEQK
ncbi:MAG: hypothetical protein WB615_01545 [Candidatus Tumulicola sp.]